MTPWQPGQPTDLPTVPKPAVKPQQVKARSYAFSKAQIFVTIDGERHRIAEMLDLRVNEHGKAQR